MIDDVKAIFWPFHNRDQMLADKFILRQLLQPLRALFNFTAPNGDLGRTQVVDIDRMGDGGTDCLHDHDNDFDDWR